MHEFIDGEEIWNALRLVGERLAAAGVKIRVIVVGGAALNLSGVIVRATTDVDIIALASGAPGGLELSPPPQPLPEALIAAGRGVARDLGLDPEWLDPRPGELWRHGLPSGLATRLTWRETGGLHVGLVDRVDLIPLKLYAAANDIWAGKARHYYDLLALRPTDAELASARTWVERQDASPAFADLLEQVLQELHREAR